MAGHPKEADLYHTGMSYRIAKNSLFNGMLR